MARRDDFTPPLLSPAARFSLGWRFLLPLDRRLWKFGTNARFGCLTAIPEPEYLSMRMQRRTAVPAPARAAKAAVAPLTAGYGLVVDGQLKAEFETRDPALKAAKDLKTRFPMLQIKVFSAEQNRSEEIVPAVA
jgi:hypothetical protein